MHAFNIVMKGRKAFIWKGAWSVTERNSITQYSGTEVLHGNIFCILRFLKAYVSMDRILKERANTWEQAWSSL